MATDHGSMKCCLWLYNDILHQQPSYSVAMKRFMDLRALQMAGMKAARHGHVVGSGEECSLIEHPELEDQNVRMFDNASNHKFNAAALLQLSPLSMGHLSIKTRRFFHTAQTHRTDTSPILLIYPYVHRE
jgi:hypothetical protein